MLAISISDTSIEVIKISRSLLRGSFVSFFSRREFPDGLKDDQVAEILKKILPACRQAGILAQKCAFALPDSKVFIHRFKTPSDLSGEALETAVLNKAKELIPDNIEGLVFTYEIKDSHVFFLAVPRQTLAEYLAIFKSLNIIPIFVASELQALWKTFRQTISKNETVMFADIGQEAGRLSFFDRLGPVLALKRKVTPKDLKKEVKKAKRAFLEGHGKEVKRVILADVKGSFRNNRSFSRALGIWTIDLNKILEDRVKDSRTKYNFGRFPLVSFTKTIGLSLLVKRKDSLNLLKPNAGRSQNPAGQFTASFRRAMIQIVRRFRGKRVKLLLTVFGVWLISLGAILAFRGCLKNKVSSTKQAVPSPTIQPSPTSELKREDLKIKVLNGGGKQGLAVTTANFLEEKGYKEIETGNADRFDYEETLISIKEEKENYLDLITEDLSSEYTIATAAAWLGKEEEFEVVIIVGRK